MFLHYFGRLLGGPWRSFGALWDPPGSLLGTFVLLWGVLGALVRVFWVPLARLGCLWAPSGAFLLTLGNRGRSLGSTLHVLFVFCILLLFLLFFLVFSHPSPHR